ncbi:MAG: A/G-specific adenine glycosylase [Asticcacaulis sp.]
MVMIIRKDKALVAALRARLLDWYDVHGRSLIWREGTRDAYRVWLSEIMLQQTTVPHATPYYEKFLRLWPTVQDLAAAEDGRVMAEWAGLGYYARARRLLECARVVVRDYGGVFPANEAQLLSLPGFGPYTAAAVAAIAFGQAANVVDGNIERIMTRLYAIETPMPKGKSAVREASAQWVSDDRAGDWPQALMDMASLICKPKAPLCGACPLAEACLAFKRGESERFPVKLAKTLKPRRYGVVFVMLIGDGVVVERRPDKGLLGGMLGLPHTQWRSEPYAEAEVTPPLSAQFAVTGSYEHVFTHFALTQEVWVAHLSEDEAQNLLRQHNDWQLMAMTEKALPTVFAKALKHIGQTPQSDLFN